MRVVLHELDGGGEEMVICVYASGVNFFFFSGDPFTVLVMLDFLCVLTATNEGSVPMSENEEMQILEEDQGDGWTRVRKSDGSEGFVPSSYVQCHFYGQDQV